MARLAQLTTDFGAINVTIERLDASGGTNIGAGVARANQHFAAASNDSRAKVAILLTDGQGSGGRAQARTAAARNITIHTIGFGGTNGNKLSDIASITNGTYNHVDDASELPEVFSRVAEEVEPQDSDGDGLPDALEEEGLPIGHTGTDVTRLPTDPDDPHTDDDGLTDGEEAGEYREYPISFSVDNTRHQYVAQYYELTSNPTLEDTDSDELDDGTEVDGWNIPVINKSGQPYRWAGSVEQSPDGTITVTSSPMLRDTDRDGLSDSAEKEFTHTDPNASVTYGLTTVHAELLTRLDDNGTYGRPVFPTQSPPEKLTDATDDFDFVLAEDRSFRSTAPSWKGSPLTFVALDGEWRTDTWLSNTNELSNGTRPWDPDTDDDGLTDGQEITHVTHFDGGQMARVSAKTLGTDPLNPDTDGDGYWDGWIGVHGVGYSDDVILYREHLQSGNGIEGEERVDEQVGIHEVGDDDPGAYLTDNGPKYHSNVHVGELHWGTGPTSDASDPSAKTQLTVEVDYVRTQRWAGNGSPFEITNDNGVTLTEAIERNYALYGIDLTFVNSTELERDDIRFPYGECYNRVCDYPHTDPSKLSRWELGKIENRHHDDEDALHLLWGTQLGTQPDEPSTIIDQRTNYGGISGIAWHVGSPEAPAIHHIESDFGIAVEGGTYTQNEFSAMQSVTMHELGHALSVGWADDAPIPTIGGLVGEHAYEVYSGSTSAGLAGGIDDTPETVEIPNPEIRWSIMGPDSGDNVQDRLTPSSEIPIFVFSIEELSIADFQSIPST